MKPGQEKEFTVHPKDAFGQRDPTLSRVISMKYFIENKINPVPGETVLIDFRTARIQSVTSGRVRVDFNHPLAGKEVKYWVKVIKQLNTVKEKAKALLDYFGLEGAVLVSGTKLKIEIKTKVDEGIIKNIKMMVIDWIKEIKDVEIKIVSEKKN